MSTRGLVHEGEVGPPFWTRSVAKVLARVETSGSQNLTSSPIAWIKNPSRRLSCFISLSFEPDTPGVVGSYTSSTYSLEAWRKNRTNGKTAQLHALLSSTNLPHAYELDSAIRLIKLAGTLAIPTIGGSSAAGNWVALCEWEPNQTIDETTLRALLRECDVELQGDPATLRP